MWPSTTLPLPSHPIVRTIYKGGFQLWKMRFVQVITLVTAIGAVFAGVTIFRIQAAGPVDPADDVSPIWPAVFIVAGVAFAVGIWYYCQIYISRVEISDDSRRLRLTFPGIVFPHRREFGVDEVESATFRDGSMRSGGMTVNAPWETIRLRGSRRRLVLDVAGDFLDQDAIDEYLLRRPVPEWTTSMPGVGATKDRRRRKRKK